MEEPKKKRSRGIAPDIAQEIENNDNNINSSEDVEKGFKSTDLIGSGLKKRKSVSNTTVDHDEMNENNGMDNDVDTDMVEVEEEEEYTERSQQKSKKSKTGLTPQTSQSAKSSKKSQVSQRTQDSSVEDEDEDEESKVREAGGIIWIDMVNFMNHTRLHVKLNANLNFITGRNGSGKSAIATALMIVLGSKTGSTGRGNNLGSLVREGATSPAIIQVCMHNAGADAYEPETFGKKIIIERQIRKTPSGCTSPYRILNGETMVEISKERKTLERILTLFNIHIQNPCCVLTQEESKKFIGGTKEEKYQFFMKATGLQAMHQDLLEAINNTELTKVAIDKSKVKLTLSKEDVKKKKEEMMRMLELDVLDAKIKECEARAYWVDVAEAGSYLSELSVRVKDSEEQAARALEAIREHEATATDVSSIAAVTAEITRASEELSRLDSTSGAIQANFKKSQIEYTQQTNKLKHMKIRKNEYAQQLQNARDQLTEVRAKVLDNAADREKILLQQISDCKNKILSAQQEEKAENSARFQAQSAISEAGEALNDWQKVERKMQSDLRRLMSEVEGLRGSDSNALQKKLLQIGGNSMVAAHAAIQRVPALRNCVIGPIGSLLTLDPRFKNNELAIELTLGQQSTAFINTSNSMAITNQLHDIFNAAKVRFDIHNQPKSARYDIPSVQGAATVLDALQIDDTAHADQIYNCLIDRIGVEKRILIDTESDSRAFIRVENGKDVYRNPFMRDMICRNGTVIQVKNGVGASAPHKNPQLRHYLGADIGEAVHSKEQEIERLQYQLQEYSKTRPVTDIRKQDAERAIAAAAEAIRAATNRGKAAMKEKKALEAELAEIHESQAQQLDTSSIEEEEAELKNELRKAADLIEDAERVVGSLKAQSAEFDKEKQLVEGKKIELDKELYTLQKQLDKAIRSVDSHKSQHNKLIGAHDKFAKIVQAVHVELKKQQATRDHCEQLARMKTAQNVNDWNQEPLQISRTDTKKKLEAEARKYQEQLAESRREQGLSGVTLVIASERYEKAEALYISQRKNFLLISKNHQDFVKDTEDRKTAYVQHRKQSTKSVNRHFDMYLSEKTMEGKCVIDHHNDGKGTLSLETTVSSGEGECHDVRQLSGGERSYVTLALLLALGHVIDAPFRVMDEYDVFLDQISRAVTLNQIQDYANARKNRKRQFIIITPHSLENIVTTSTCQIIRMKDPERRKANGLQQSVLNVTRG